MTVMAFPRLREQDPAILPWGLTRRESENDWVAIAMSVVDTLNRSWLSFLPVLEAALMLYFLLEFIP